MTTAKNSSLKQTKVLTILRKPLSIAVIAVGLVVAGGVGVAYAANPSKPGDALYSLDRAAEKVQLAFSLTDGAKASTYKSLAKERLSELQDLFAEKNVDAPGIATALAAFDKQKQQATTLAEKTGDTHAQDELAGLESDVDKLFEDRQSSLEQERESLKAQYEAAVKAGNTELASQLKAQIDAFEPRLKDLETKREASKKEQEKFQETLKAQDEKDKSAQESVQEAAKKQQEALSEAVKKEVEAQNEAAKKLEEQQQKAAEQQAESTKKAQEQQAEDAKKLNESSSEDH